MKEIPLLVTQPDVIELVCAVRNGKVPVAELRRKLGRHKTDRAISKCQEMMIRINQALQEWLENPAKVEWEFIKELAGIHNGREKKHYVLNDKIEVKPINTSTMIIVFKGEL